MLMSHILNSNFNVLKENKDRQELIVKLGKFQLEQCSFLISMIGAYQVLMVYRSVQIYVYVNLIKT